MIKVYKKGSDGLGTDYDCILVDENVSGLIEIDKLNSHNDVEFSYPIVDVEVVGVAVANKNLICGPTLICGSTITNHNSNETQFIEREVILNVDGALYVVYSAIVDGSNLVVKGSDYMNIDTLQQMLMNHLAEVKLAENEIALMKNEVAADYIIVQALMGDATTNINTIVNAAVASAIASLNSIVANANTSLTSQINANLVNYNATMATIHTDNEAYVADYISSVGTTAVFGT